MAGIGGGGGGGAGVGLADVGGGALPVEESDQLIIRPL